MNKQIAIDILEKEKAYMQQHAGKEQVEAFDMAICALKMSEQEIRDKAIDGFAERLNEKCNSMIAEKWNSEVAPISWANAYADFKDDIDEIARQMKEVGV